MHGNSKDTLRNAQLPDQRGTGKFVINIATEDENFFPATAKAIPMRQELIDQLFLVAGQDAKQQGLPITLTVVDTGGHVRAVLRQEGCSYFALESSRRKAITASQLRIPSHVVGEIGERFPALQASFKANPDISELPGGFPVLWEGVVVGGLGVAGGNFDQDQAIGAAAVATLSTR